MATVVAAEWRRSTVCCLDSEPVNPKSSPCGPTAKCDGQQLHLKVHCLLCVCVGGERPGQDCCWLINGCSCGLPQHRSTCDWCSAACVQVQVAAHLTSVCVHLVSWNNSLLFVNFLCCRLQLFYLVALYFIGLIVSYIFLERSGHSMQKS